MRTALRLGTCFAMLAACFAVFGCANAPPVNQSYLTNPSFAFADQQAAYTTADQARRVEAEVAATYDANCKSCHGVAAAGSASARPIAGLPVPEVKKAITQGKGNMKPIQLANADAVARYVAGLKK